MTSITLRERCIRFHRARLTVARIDEQSQQARAEMAALALATRWQAWLDRKGLAVVPKQDNRRKDVLRMLHASIV